MLAAGCAGGATVKELNYEDDDLVRRVFVHYLDYNALVQWSMETQTWMQEAQRCFNRLTGVDE